MRRARRRFVAAPVLAAATMPVAGLALAAAAPGAGAGGAGTAPKPGVEIGFADDGMMIGHWLRDPASMPSTATSLVAPTAAPASAARPSAAAPSAGAPTSSAPSGARSGAASDASFDAASDLTSGPGSDTASEAFPDRLDVVIVGAGIAGLAAARALRRAGIDRYRLLDVGSAAGGNSRAASVGGLACPSGAHYLPLPGPAAIEVTELLTDLGVRDADGRYDERMLVQAPQERLFLNGVWQEGLLPLIAQPRSTLDQYRRFADVVARWQASGGFTIPAARGAGVDVLALRDQTFAQWLDSNGFDAPALRWFLDYCCRDDFGAGSAIVSAWAGIHYFASRHGFALPPGLAARSGSGDRALEPGRDPVLAPAGAPAGDPGTIPASADDPGGRDRAAAEGRDVMLTWPAGNGWLVDRLVEPHRAELRTRHLVRRLERTADGWLVDSLDCADPSAPRRRRYRARVVIWAAPLAIAARVVAPTEPEAAWLDAALVDLSVAPWLVANVLVDPAWRPIGGELAWDNVVYGGDGLGYINARQQRLDRLYGPSLLTWYQALGDRPDGRRELASASATSLAARCIAELSRPHPEIGRWIRAISLHRHGHAMAIPTPRSHRNPALGRLGAASGDLVFAHADLSGYSIFEEAMYRGTLAATRAVARLGGVSGSAPASPARARRS